MDLDQLTSPLHFIAFDLPPYFDSSGLCHLKSLLEKKVVKQSIIIEYE